VQVTGRPPLRACAATSSFLVLETPIAFLSALYVALALKDPTMWIIAGSCLGIGLLTFLWLRAFEIEIADDTLTYSSLFGGTQAVALSDILNVRPKTVWGSQPPRAATGTVRYFAPTRPTTRLVVAFRTGEHLRTFEINLKVFGMPEVKRLLEALSSEGKMKPRTEPNQPTWA